LSHFHKFTQGYLGSIQDYSSLFLARKEVSKLKFLKITISIQKFLPTPNHQGANSFETSFKISPENDASN